MTQITEKLNKLLPLAYAYQNIARDLIAIKVPSKVSSIHLNLANAFALVSDNLIQISASANDPLKMLVLINTYPDSIKKLEDATKQFSVL